MREDVGILRGVLEESHVGLHWYISKEALDRKFDALDASLSGDAPAEAFHKRLLPLVAGLGHGHTTLSLPVAGVGYRLRGLSRDQKYLPFEIRILDDGLYVTTNCSAVEQARAGTRIVSINGQPTEHVLAEMLPYLSADGHSESFKHYLMERDYRFHALLHLLHGPSESFDLECVAPGEKQPVRMTVPARPPAEIAEAYRRAKGVDIDHFGPQLGLEFFDGGQTAALKVGSFYEGLIKGGGQEFEAFIAESFAKLKAGGAENLILDLRDNEGGNGDLATLLYSYLAHEPFRLGSPTIVASKRLSYFRYAENPSEDVKQFAAAPESFVVEGEGGAWVLRPEIDEESQKVYEPNADAFTGRLYVLTNGGSFSATNSLIDLIIRYHRMKGRPALFVGTPNGGDNAAGWLSGGQSLTVVLPHSKQRLTVPLLASRRLSGGAAKQPPIPDHRVVPSIDDVVGGVDREMLFTRQLAVERRN